jgi:hypothetical protein
MRDWIAIKVDMTDEDAPGLREKLDRFKVIGDPSTILIDFDVPGGGHELLRFNEYVPAMKMASAIRAAAARARSLRAEER